MITKEQKAAYQRQWRTANRDRTNEIARKSYRTNRDKIRAYQATPEYRERKNELRRRKYAGNRVEEQFKARQRTVRMSKEDFSQMLGEQMGCCKGCGCAMSMQRCRGDSCCRDHDHKTGKVRGLLCNNCNTALGYAKDSIVVLQRLIAYLTQDSS